VTAHKKEPTAGHLKKQGHTIFIKIDTLRIFKYSAAMLYDTR